MANNTEKPDLILQGARAKKEILKLAIKHNVTLKHLNENHPEIGDRIKEINEITRLSKPLAIAKLKELNKANLEKSEKLREQRDIHSKVNLKKSKEHRLKHTYRYPPSLALINYEDKALYREIFTLYINSGMSKEAAERYSIRDFLRTI